MAIVADPLLHDQRLEVLGGGTHRGIALTEGHHRQSIHLELLRQLRGVPPVDGDITDLVLLPELGDAGPDQLVVDHIPID